MMAFYHAHSGLRFLVLLAALVALVWLGFALATKKPFNKLSRVLPSIFVGLLDLQIVLGIVTAVATKRWYPAMWGHVMMMVLAAGVVHVLLVVNRKKATPGNMLALLAVVLGTVLIVAGISAIGRGPFEMALVAPAG